MHTHWLVALAALGPVAVQFVLFLRWMLRRMRDADIERAFIRDIAVNHLPHIYHALRQIAAHSGFVLDEPPPVRWLDLYAGREARSSE